jgi:putative FmdB family regulatory protein
LKADRNREKNMPTYTYRCESCGDFELQQPISDQPLNDCPQCKGPVKRIIAGGTGFIMKGKGASASRCDRETPCCGRETRCDKPPCGK